MQKLTACPSRTRWHRMRRHWRYAPRLPVFWSTVSDSRRTLLAHTDADIVCENICRHVPLLHLTELALLAHTGAGSVCDSIRPHVLPALRHSRHLLPLDCSASLRPHRRPANHRCGGQQRLSSFSAEVIGLHCLAAPSLCSNCRSTRMLREAKPSSCLASKQVIQVWSTNRRR